MKGLQVKTPDYNDDLLPNFDEPEPPLWLLIACVDREIKYRRNAYPRRIERGTMKPEFAWRQINLMEAVKRKLESLAATS